MYNNFLIYRYKPDDLSDEANLHSSNYQIVPINSDLFEVVFKPTLSAATLTVQFLRHTNSLSEVFVINMEIFACFEQIGKQQISINMINTAN